LLGRDLKRRPEAAANRDGNVTGKTGLESRRAAARGRLSHPP